MEDALCLSVRGTRAAMKRRNARGENDELLRPTQLRQPSPAPAPAHREARICTYEKRDRK